MPHILYTLDYTPKEPSELNKFSKMLRKLYEQLARVINGFVSFGDGTNRDNINGEWATVPDTGLANTNFVIVHKMGRLPIGYILTSSDRAVSIYNGSMPPTDTVITLRASIANASIRIFII